MRVISAPRLPSAKLPSPSISPHIYLSTNDPFHVQHASEDSPINTIYASMNALMTPDESKSTNANTATSGQIDYKTWPATPLSSITAQASMRKLPATYQSQSPGDLLSRSVSLTLFKRGRSI
jgi:hypothetical protein